MAVPSPGVPGGAPKPQPAPPGGRANPQKGEEGGCQLVELLRLLGKAHVLNILYTVSESQGPHRFVELQKRLSISPNTLSDRLRELVGAGLLARTPYNTIPPRVDYEATAKARELAPVFEQLTEWSQRHTLKPVPVAPAKALT